MKQIIAYLKPHKLEDVLLALHKIPGLTGLSVLQTEGCGRSRKWRSGPPLDQDTYALLPRIKLEVACSEPLVDTVITTIEQSAHTGLKGDGKIYVLPVVEAVRISSGERGVDAI